MSDTSLGPRVDRTEIVPPVGVKRIAFDSRLRSTCWRRRASPLTMAGESTTQSRWIPLRSISGRTAWHASSSASWMRIGRGSMRRAPLTTRDMSTRSSRSCRCRSALRRMTWSASRTSGGRSRRGSSTCVQPRMAFSGLRSSCEMVVRNSSRRCAASSAAARRRVSSSTVSCSSRMRMASSAERPAGPVLEESSALVVVAVATEPERARQRDDAGQRPHRPPDSRVNREQQGGRQGHARMHSNNVAGRSGIPAATVDPSVPAGWGRGAAKVVPGRLRVDPWRANRW